MGYKISEKLNFHSWVEGEVAQVTISADPTQVDHDGEGLMV